MSDELKFWRHMQLLLFMAFVYTVPWAHDCGVVASRVDAYEACVEKWNPNICGGRP